MEKGVAFQQCVKSCKGLPNGDYQSCLGCDHFVTCVWDSMVAQRSCPVGLKWDDNKKICDWFSKTCP
ncbi:hypothetical protein CHS0354_004010 [Potamilus streckersoni]|uniref:Chitin-binding type-2 domain-containing protein n=1 Tax=Potamilus streckersoni TaxID=2493646 RepID=A0AAE0VNC6_9BIVA|nr:hypothetical protein CHS0354_004010 [Potamilus streckersoni]